MRKPEQKVWDTFKRHIVGVLKAYRIENEVGEAMPDVIAENRKGTSFWLELKALKAWPARSTTFPLKDKFQPGQIGWSRDWKSWKGFAFVLVRVETTGEWLLLNTDHDLAFMTKAELLSEATIKYSLVETLIYLKELE